AQRFPAGPGLLRGAWALERIGIRRADTLGATPGPFGRVQRGKEVLSLVQEQRFTIDGGEDLERHLARTCERVRVGVQQIIPSRKLEGLVLGGSYGRGEGGVLQTSEGERPYNDMDFYVFVRGTSWWKQRRYGEELIELSERLSPGAGLHVEL